MTTRVRVVVCGYIVRGPLGGLAWHHLHYVLGLHRMGHDVVFVEDSDDYESCYDPSRGTVDTDPTYGLSFATAAFDRLGLGGRWSYFDAHRDQWHGPLGPDGPAVFDNADVILNVSGVNPPRPWWENVEKRVLIDTDPVFTQVRHLQSPEALAAAQAHTSFFSFGENVGRTGGGIPDDGLPWRPTRQPIVLDAWPTTEGPQDGPWTTVMQWDSYAERRWHDTVYGMKSRSFADYLDLPGRLPGCRFELAVGSASAPRDELRQHGWGMLDPLAVTADPWVYQRFVQGSKAELSVAKHGYVVSGSGWFSERTAGYLAAGRPAVVQDTGFSQNLPVGKGLLAFSSPDEAAAAVAAVNADYRSHCRAAVEIAEAAFDHRIVLENLLDNL